MLGVINNEEAFYIKIASLNTANKLLKYTICIWLFNGYG